MQITSLLITAIESDTEINLISFKDLWNSQRNAHGL